MHNKIFVNICYHHCDLLLLPDVSCVISLMRAKNVCFTHLLLGNVVFNLTGWQSSGNQFILFIL